MGCIASSVQGRHRSSCEPAPSGAGGEEQLSPSATNGGDDALSIPLKLQLHRFVSCPRGESDNGDLVVYNGDNSPNSVDQQRDLRADYEKIMMMKTGSDQILATAQPQCSHQKKSQRQSLGSKLLSMLIHGKVGRNGIRVANATVEEKNVNGQKSGESATRVTTSTTINESKRKSTQANQGNAQANYKSLRESGLVSTSAEMHNSDNDNRLMRTKSYSGSGDEAESRMPRVIEQPKLGSRAADEDEVILFTSVQQLCHDIINQKLLVKTRPKSAEISNLLCLFIFGRQGSNKGELSYELVDHSSLTEFIDNMQDRHHSLERGRHQMAANNCPLYHFIDVSALIVSNIDKRIKEYNHLVNQALRIKHQQAELNSQTSVDDSQCSTTTCLTKEDVESETLNAEESEKNNSSPTAFELEMSQREASILSEISATSSSEMMIPVNQNDTIQLDDQIGNMITLSTKQRSVLQMRILRYKSCVTIKWVLNLIDKEIDRLEQILTIKSKEMSDSEGEGDVSIPNRVYLINLVPNQLNLFKPCLYLQQCLAFNEFNRPCWGLRFERRTNIKVMVKEMAVNDAKSTISQFKLPHHLIKFPTLGSHSPPSPSSSSPREPPIADQRIKVDVSNNKVCYKKGQDDKVAAATELLSNGLNEKLGPKYNESFASQFQAMGRLMKLRYNPIRNYNYANYMDYCLATNGGDTNQAGNRLTRTLNCYQYLNRQNNHEETSSDAPSPSSISSSSQTSHSLDMMPLSPSITTGNTKKFHIGAGGSMNNLTLDEPSSGSNDQQRLSTIFSFNDTHKALRTKSMNNLEVSSMTCPSLVARNSYLSSGSSNAVAGGLEEKNANYSLTSCKPMNQQQRLISGCLVPKWAVELELIVDKSSKYLVRVPGAERSCNSSSTDNVINNQSRWLRTPSPMSSRGDKEQPSRHNKRHSNDSTAPSTVTRPMNEDILNIFHPPSSRSGSRSPLIFNAERIKQSNSYFLIQTKVAYANGKNQKVAEVKRFHHRVLNYKSRSDVSKLLRLVAKARYNLSTDLSTWLAPAIVSYITGQQQQTLQPNDGKENKSYAVNKRPSASGHNQLSLVTYTIRVDISQLLKKNSDGGINNQESDQSDVYVVAANSSKSRRGGQKPDRTELQRPASSIGFAQQSIQVSDGTGRPASSLVTATNRKQTNNNSKKHVRFRLSQAPGEKADQFELNINNRSLEMPDKLSQHRTWIGDSIFASCREPNALNSMALLVEAIKSVTKCDTITN